MKGNEKVIIFDLDDTLYKEFDFLYSAYDEISRLLSTDNSDILFLEMIAYYKKGINVFNWLQKNVPNVSISQLLSVYRNHKPKISLSAGAENLLNNIKKKKIPMGIITDGRSINQRNKINALNIEKYFDYIIISEEFGSEKPNPKNYQFFEEKYPDCNFTYIGDNINKDFVTPNSLNWQTWCLIDNGMNIHNQVLYENYCRERYYPKRMFKTLSEINLCI